jgi:RNA polymerase sigma-70 factor (ECF subfamily)
MADPDPGDQLPSNGSTSRSLLVNARCSVPAAWERLVTLYAPFVALHCRRWGVAEQDVGDVLQEVFAAVSANLEHFRKERPCDTFRGWLWTIARNKVRDHFRRRANEPAPAGGTEATRQMQQIPQATPAGSPIDHGTDEQPDEQLLDCLLRQALESIRGEFHAQTWKAFWGVLVEGRSTADVAADLQMKPGTVRVAKSRVLRRLRRELGDIA